MVDQNVGGHGSTYEASGMILMHDKAGNCIKLCSMRNQVVKALATSPKL